MDDVCIQEEVQITIPCKLKIVSLLATIRCQKFSVISKKSCSVQNRFNFTSILIGDRIQFFFHVYGWNKRQIKNLGIIVAINLDAPNY